MGVDESIKGRGPSKHRCFMEIGACPERRSVRAHKVHESVQRDANCARSAAAPSAGVGRGREGAHWHPEQSLENAQNWVHPSTHTLYRNPDDLLSWTEHLRGQSYAQVGTFLLQTGVGALIEHTLSNLRGPISGKLLWI